MRSDDILEILRRNGGGSYFGESVTQLEHALQTAFLAEREGAADSLVIAALLHDIGHLLHGLGEEAANQGIDGMHEDVGATWLSPYFGRPVVDPVRLHVSSKRYLCAVDPRYEAALSPASRQSLRLQGGGMTSEEIRAFEGEAHWREAVRLRRWDDAAKVPRLAVPELDHYRERIESLLAAHRAKDDRRSRPESE
jgi:gamma-butyrobetaine dioxygenase